MEQYRGPNLSMPANFRAALKTGKTLLGIGLSFPSVEVAKKVAITGYDWVFIDAEHAAFTPVLLAELVQTISFYSQGKTIPLVRVPKHEPSFVSTVLDAGAAGVMLPHTETKEDAQHLINMCRFPPSGHRSYPPWSWVPGVNDQVPEGQTIMSLSNESIACIAQIESKLGVENAEDIISLEGIDAVMIGLGDLRLDMNLPFTHFGKEPEYLAAVEKIENLCYKYNKPLCGFAFPEMKELWEAKIRKKYQILMTAADLYTLVYGLTKTNMEARASLAALQEKMAEEEEKVAKSTSVIKVVEAAESIASEEDIKVEA